MVSSKPQNVKNPHTDAALALNFLRVLWPDPPDGFALLWLLRGKRSLWFATSDLEAVADAAVKHAAQTDVYLACGLSPTDNGPSKRCEADRVVAIPGLWADIDIAGAAHKKKGLPPDADAALSLAEAMPLPPSMIVRSGHGFQAWWALKEAWVFASDAERKSAASLVERWQAHLIRLAAERGWAVDSTHDMARVLRLPGTINHKRELVPVTCDLLEPIRRYDPQDFRDALPEDAPHQRNGKARRSAAEWKSMSEGVSEGSRNEKGVAILGRMLSKLTDPTDADAVCVLRDWFLAWNQLCTPPQPEEDALRSFDSILRKELRQREQRDLTAAPAGTGTPGQPPTPAGTGTPGQPPPPPNAPAEFAIIHKWFAKFGIALIGVRRVHRQFFLILQGNAEVELGTKKEVLTPSCVQAAVIEHASKKAYPLISKKKWLPIGWRICRIADIADVGNPKSDELREWIADFLTRIATRLANEKEPFDVWLVRKLNGGQPVRDERGVLLLTLAGLQKHIRDHFSPVTRDDLISRLVTAGWERVTPRLSARDEAGKREYARAWKPPIGWEDA